MITQFATREEPPYDRNGVVRPVSGIRRVTPPMTTKTWRARTPARPVAISLPKPSRQTRAARRARSTMQAVHQDHGDDAGEAELLADGATMKSDSAYGHPLGAAVAEAAADQPAPAHAEHRLDELERASSVLCVVVAERVQPDVEPVGHVGDEEVRRAISARRRRAAPPTTQPPGPLGGDVEHDQEEAEEQQAGAEVALEDEDAEADQPHREDRAEVAAARQVDEQDPAAGERERVAVQHEVAGERDHEQHLGDLAGLEAERAEADPDPGAVDGGAEPGDHRQQQQHDRGQAEGVGDPLQRPGGRGGPPGWRRTGSRRGSSRSAAAARSRASRPAAS